MINGADSFHYLTELQRTPRKWRPNPSEWMPWNYREMLGGPLAHDDSV